MNQVHNIIKKPAKVFIEKGKKYFWCSCGLSTHQPFCDGKHKNSKFMPTIFIATTSKDVYLCQCKASDNKPYCDGKHKELDAN